MFRRLIARTALLPLGVALCLGGCFVTLEPHDRSDGGPRVDTGSGGCGATLAPCVSGGFDGYCVDGACCLTCVELRAGTGGGYFCGAGATDVACGGDTFCQDCTRSGQSCIANRCQ